MAALLQCVARFSQFDPRAFSRAGLGVEIQDFSSAVLLETNWEDRVAAYRAALASFEGLVAVHGACIDLNPASADPRIRALTRERYLHSLQIAEQLKATYVVFHSQINPAVRGDTMRSRRLERQKPFWEEMTERAEAAGATVVIENVYETNCRELVRLVEGIGSPRVKVCLDVGHLKVHSPLPLGDWVYGCAAHLAYVHLHDNDGRYDRHQPPTRETLEALFEALSRQEIDPAISLEYEPKLAPTDEVKRVRAVADSVGDS